MASDYRTVLLNSSFAIVTINEQTFHNDLYNIVALSDSFIAICPHLSIWNQDFWKGRLPNPSNFIFFMAVCLDEVILPSAGA